MSTIGLTVEIFTKPSCQVVLMTYLKPILLTLMLPAWGLFSSIAVADFADPNVTSWVKLKQKGVVIQQHETSCGAAAIATLLQGFYGKSSITEEEILLQSGKKGDLTGTDIPKILLAAGYELEGTAPDYNKHLSFAGEGSLTVKYPESPTLVFLARDTSGKGHWAVLRGVHPQYGVMLADPFFGNLEVSVDEFKKQWLFPPNAKLSSEGDARIRCKKDHCGIAIILKTPLTNPNYFKQPQPYNPFSH
jgi:hypothetical protein